MRPLEEREHRRCEGVDVVYGQRLHKHRTLAFDIVCFKESIELHGVGDKVAMRQHGAFC